MNQDGARSANILKEDISIAAGLSISDEVAEVSNNSFVIVQEIFNSCDIATDKMLKTPLQDKKFALLLLFYIYIKANDISNFFYHFMGEMLKIRNFQKFHANKITEILTYNYIHP